ncbi:MAG: hypothetical protein K6G16_00900 [Lachnospiraceae bacterium]|nr:hypothetical protein [Lachnospiraceae bacterium]
MIDRELEKKYLQYLPEDRATVRDLCVLGADGRRLAEEITEKYPDSTIWWMEDPDYFVADYENRVDVLLFSADVCASAGLPEIMRRWCAALKQEGTALCICDHERYTVLSFLNTCQMCGFAEVTPLDVPLYRMARPAEDPDFLPVSGQDLRPRFDRVYVLCPALYRSGGPEVLHQLVHCINVLGGHADIAYVWTEDKEIYGNPDLIPYVAGHIVRAEDIVDAEGTAVVAPEIFVEYLAPLVRSEVFLWWLSADNFAPTYPPESLDMLWKFIRQCVPHNLYQSVHAREFCICNGVLPRTLSPLSDYISARYFEEDYLRITDREDRVLYSPKRGIAFTEKLMKAAPELQWVPLQNMSAAQVQDLMCHSKVYIDFGTHPGKDRMPREAAMCGCCVITGRQGSAAYSQDVGIPEEYRFFEEETETEEILRAIRGCLSDYDREKHRYDAYREAIRAEKQIFRKNVERLFFTDCEEER